MKEQDSGKYDEKIKELKMDDPTRIAKEILSMEYGKWEMEEEEEDDDGPPSLIVVTEQKIGGSISDLAMLIGDYPEVRNASHATLQDMSKLGIQSITLPKESYRNATIIARYRTISEILPRVPRSMYPLKIQIFQKGKRLSYRTKLHRDQQRVLDIHIPESIPGFPLWVVYHKRLKPWKSLYHFDISTGTIDHIVMLYHCNDSHEKWDSVDVTLTSGNHYYKYLGPQTISRGYGKRFHMEYLDASNFYRVVLYDARYNNDDTVQKAVTFQLKQRQQLLEDSIVCVFDQQNYLGEFRISSDAMLWNKRHVFPYADEYQYNIRREIQDPSYVFVTMDTGEKVILQQQQRQRQRQNGGNNTMFELAKHIVTTPNQHIVRVDKIHTTVYHIHNSSKKNKKNSDNKMVYLIHPIQNNAQFTVDPIDCSIQWQRKEEEDREQQYNDTLLWEAILEQKKGKRQVRVICTERVQLSFMFRHAQEEAYKNMTKELPEDVLRVVLKQLKGQL